MKTKAKMVMCRKRLWVDGKQIWRCTNKIPSFILNQKKPFCTNCKIDDINRKRFHEHRLNPNLVLDLDAD